MTWMQYSLAALSAWFLGFFPLAEVDVAVPAAMATGLDPYSVIFWTVFGNTSALLLVQFGYNGLLKVSFLQGWLTNLVSATAQAHITRWGIWFVLLFTPWTGVWVMTVTARTLGMNQQRFVWLAFASILLNAVVLVWLIQAGIDVFHAAT